MSLDKYAVMAVIMLCAGLATVTVLPLLVGIVAAAPGLVIVALAWWMWSRRK